MVDRYGLKWDKRGRSGAKCLAGARWGFRLVDMFKTIYNGEFDHGIDEKRRVQIPSRWRPNETAFEFTLVLWPDKDNGSFLRVLPPWKMDRLIETMETMPYSDGRSVSLARLLGRHSCQVSLDKGGRICLPGAMSKEAGLEKSAKLVGGMQWFEIWNPERFKKVASADDALRDEALKLI